MSPKDENRSHDESTAAGEERAAELLARYLDTDDGRPDPEQLDEMDPAVAADLREGLEALETIDDLLAGDASKPMLGDYRLVREIGRGGMGVVYEAEQISLGRTVALKVLAATGVLDDRHVQRFRNEARAAAALHHQNIVPVFAVGCERNVHYYVMQIVDGVSLHRVLRAMHDLPEDEPGPHTAIGRRLMDGRFDPRRRGEECAEDAESDSGDRSSSTGTPAWLRSVADLMRQAASALEHAHQGGILHRDVKPSNLLLDAHGHVWVTDFGLAHFLREESSELTRSGEIVGTLAYSSPEQVAGGRTTVDHRSDVYSIGATLYELATGQAPFQGRDRAKLICAVLSSTPRAPRRINPQIPRDLETIVERAMAKEPGDRYQSAADLAADLQSFVEDRPIRARPLRVTERALRWCRRNPPLATATGAAIVLAMVAGAIHLSALQTARERDRAVRAEARLAITSARTAADARRRTPTPGRSRESLALLRGAAAQLENSELAPDEVRDMRRALRADVLASLSLVDPEPVRLMRRESFAVYDASFSRCASYADGTVTMHEAPGGSELARIAVDGSGGLSMQIDPTGEWVALSPGDERGAGRLRLWHWRTGRTIDLADTLSRIGSWAFAPKGAKLVAALLGARIAVCDLARGEWTERSFGVSPGEEPISDPSIIAVNARGTRVATASYFDDRVDVHELDSARAPITLRAADTVWSLTWHPAQDRLAVSGAGHAVQIFDPDRRSIVGTLRGHHHTVTQLAWSPDGRLIASTGWDLLVRITEVATGVALLSFPATAGQLRFSADGSGFGFTLDDDGVESFWTLPRAPIVASLHDLERPHSEDPRIAVHPDGRLAATLVRDGTMFWDLARGERLGFLPLDSPKSVYFEGCGDLIVAGGFGCERYPIAIEAREVRVDRPQRIAAGNLEVHGTPDGEVLCTLDTTVLRVYERDGARPRVLGGGDPEGVHLVVSPDGRWAAAGGWSCKHLVIWDLDAGRVAHRVPAQTCRVWFGPDSKRLLTSDGGLFRVLELGTWRELLRVEGHGGIGYGAFSPDGRFLALTSGHSVEVMSTGTGEIVFELPCPDDVALRFLGFTPDGSRLLATSYLRNLYVWDLQVIRRELQPMGLDWSEMPIATRALPGAQLSLHIAEK